MVSRFIAAAFGTDRRAIETLGTALAGSRFVVTFATMALTPGRLATEGRPIPGCRIENIASSPDAKTAEAETGAGASMISSSARERLKDWANYLPAILHGSPCTQVLHGYSGHWRVVLSF